MAAIDLRQRNSGLDGIRGLAVLLVFLAHIEASIKGEVARGFSGGVVGVDMFCVLSGFFITSILINELNSSGKISFTNFYIRRAARLVPATALLLASTIPLMARQSEIDAAMSVISLLLFNFNFYVIERCGELNPITHLWSLSLEEQYYLIWPITLYLLWRAKCKLRSILALVLILGLGSSIWRMIQFGDGDGSYCGWLRPYLGTDCRLFGLSLGSALAISISAGVFNRWNRILDILLTLFLFATITIVLSVGEKDFWMYYGSFEIASIFSALLILKVLLDRDSKSTNVLSIPAFAFTGRISFGIYLWHYPIVQAGYTQSWTGILMSMLATFLIAFASYQLIELPILKLSKSRFNSQ